MCFLNYKKLIFLLFLRSFIIQIIALPNAKGFTFATANVNIGSVAVLDFNFASFIQKFSKAINGKLNYNTSLDLLLASNTLTGVTTIDMSIFDGALGIKQDKLI